MILTTGSSLTSVSCSHQSSQDDFLHTHEFSLCALTASVLKFADDAPNHDFAYSSVDFGEALAQRWCADVGAAEELEETLVGVY